MVLHLVPFALAALLALPLTAAAGEIASSVDAAALSKSRQTTAGLYVTAADAGAALAADPGVVLIDVRTQAEFEFVGHAEAADGNVPFRFLTDRFDPKAGAYALKDNPHFLADMAALMARAGKGKADPVFVMCRSGSRSAAAANALSAAGYTRVYNVVDGFEGDKDKATGHRTVDGWRNAGLAWTYRIAPEAAYQPAR